MGAGYETPRPSSDGRAGILQVVEVLSVSTNLQLTPMLQVSYNRARVRVRRMCFCFTVFAQCAASIDGFMTQNRSSPKTKIIKNTHSQKWV